MSRFSGVYEHSPWVAERLMATHGELDDIAEIEAAMAKIVDDASFEEKMELIRKHPDLAVSQDRAGQMTMESREEQHSAGLDSCSSGEVQLFDTLNKKYRERFGFPFVIAVRGRSRYQILDAFETRLGNDFDSEFSNAMDEIHKIAALRLQRLNVRKE